MTTGKKKKTNPLISPLVPIVGVGVTAFGFMLLRPGVEARSRQLYHSGKPSEALRLIRESRADGEKDPNGKLSSLEMEILAGEFRKADALVQRRMWFDALELRVKYDPPHDGPDPLIMMTRELRDPTGIWTARRAILLAPSNQALREALISRLLGAVHPEEAAAFLEASLAAEGAIAGDAERIRLASYYRQSSMAGAALAAIAPIPEKRYTPELRALRIALLRESGRSKEALAYFVGELAAHENTSVELAELSATALAAGDPAAADSIFKKYTLAHPGDAKTHRLYSELLANMGRSGDAARELKAAMRDGNYDRKDLERLAQLCGWANDVTGLQDALLRLAIDGDPASLARLATIGSIPEDESLPPKLAVAVTAKGREAELVPAAEFLATIGDYDLSVGLYRRHIAIRPFDGAALSSLALILFETGKPEEALPLLDRAVKIKPEDMALRLRYAEALLNENHGDDALSQYAIIARHDPTADNFGVVRRLAQSLGRNDIAADAAESRLSPSLKPEAEDFVIAQNLAKSAGRSAKATEILKTAVQKFPDNKSVRLFLATRLSDSTDHSGALEVMRLHPALKTDPEAAALWLDLMLLTDAKSDERAYFAEGVPPVAMTSTALRMRAARVLTSLARYPEALALQKALVEELPGDRNMLRDYLGTLMLTGNRKETLRLLREKLNDDSPESLRLSALVYADNADYIEAERKTRKLIAAPGESTTDNWSMLGDFRISRGDTRGAKQAYAKAYSVLMTEGKKAEAKL